ncbi:MAG TPA: hypothetical protein VE338_16740 [Ktedonobacterales bacterium]|jgi:hypothetical protein|nr:hypothetical protein [Ktedonobacterales bacterium]
MRFPHFSDFPHFLRSLPFWPETRPDYFTHGLVDGKAAALGSQTILPPDNAQISELAIVAMARLPGRVTADDAHIYQLGWIEGYHIRGERVAPLPTGAVVTQS